MDTLLRSLSVFWKHVTAQMLLELLVAFRERISVVFRDRIDLTRSAPSGVRLMNEDELLTAFTEMSEAATKSGKAYQEAAATAIEDAQRNHLPDPDPPLPGAVLFRYANHLVYRPSRALRPTQRAHAEEIQPPPTTVRQEISGSVCDLEHINVADLNEEDTDSYNQLRDARLRTAAAFAHDCAASAESDGANSTR